MLIIDSYNLPSRTGIKWFARKIISMSQSIIVIWIFATCFITISWNASRWRYERARIFNNTHKNWYTALTWRIFSPGYIIQFCILACFFWLTVMWIDICIHAWYYLPRGIKQTPKDDNLHLMYYGLFSFGLPIILVILTYKNKFTGLPSYYLKGTTEGAYAFYF